jgi:pimeloyl-ACP methyl ester carboxylesterase
MERFQLANAEIEVDVRGEGQTLLFLHGEDYFEQHKSFLDALAEHYRIIVPRHPGFGGSPLPGNFRSIDDLAYLYLDLLDHMKIEAPVLAGASLGGWIALEMAVRSPERFDKLVLLGTVGVKLGGREERDFADIYQIPEDEVRRLTFANSDRWGPSYAELSDDQLMAIARDRETTVHFAWRPYMHNPTLRTWLHRVQIPTLLLWGDKDGVTNPDYAGALADTLPRAQLHVIADAGHYPQVEQTDEVVKAIADFAET